MFFFLWCFFIIIWIIIIWIIIIALISLLCQPRPRISSRNVIGIDENKFEKKDKKKKVTLVVKGNNGSGRTIINANRINLNVKRT